MTVPESLQDHATISGESAVDGILILAWKTSYPVSLKPFLGPSISNNTSKQSVLDAYGITQYVEPSSKPVALLAQVELISYQ